MPVVLSTTLVGILDLFRRRPGSLSGESLTGGLLAAKLAASPLLERMSDQIDDGIKRDAREGTSLERVEVHQATGMLMEHLQVGAEEALVRSRGHAFATGQTASDLAWALVERRLAPDSDLWSGGSEHAESAP